MKKVTVEAMGSRYDIIIAKGLLNGGAAEHVAQFAGKKAVVITDETVGRLYGGAFLETLGSAGIDADIITVAPGEESKSAETLLWLYSRLVASGITRGDAVFALGGGVVGDLAGFAAATCLRGVPLVQVPTTLLAQTDSSVGGKVAINLPEGKNLVGTFYQPALVLADISVMRTQSGRELAAGMAEIIKYGAIKDAELFRSLENAGSLNGALEGLEDIVARCCGIKAWYCHEDPYDRGVRTELNFGHTLGHALENAAGYGTVLHGEGVALGMLAAAKVGERLGITVNGTYERLYALISRMGLADTPAKTASIRVREAMRCDKKTNGKELKLVLLESIGKAKIVGMPAREAIGMLCAEAEL